MMCTTCLRGKDKCWSYTVHNGGSRPALTHGWTRLALLHMRYSFPLIRPNETACG